MSQSSPEATLLSIKEARKVFPEAAEARRALKNLAGEAFCEFRFTGLTVGTIADDHEPISFAITRTDATGESGSVDAQIKIVDGIHCGLLNSGRNNGFYHENPSIPEVPINDTFSTYLGHYNFDGSPNDPLPEGPHTLITSHDIEQARKLDRLHTTLVVGDKACGAFAIGRALAELDTNPSNMDISTGLRLADMLDRSDVPWRPRRDNEQVKMAEAISQLKEAFADKVIVPSILGKLALGRAGFPVPGSIGRRVSILSFDRYSLCRQVLEKIQGSNDESLLNKLAWLGLNCEPDGNSYAYLNNAISNILTNQFGISD